jgi:hypothetical protein
MLHREILSLIDHGIPIGHLEKRRSARVNNHFESEFKLKSRGERIEEQGSKYFLQILKIRLRKGLFYLHKRSYD